ncbi:hypothetical protein ADUPG1_011515, partial [Aduncisulcus paluster]
MGLFSKTIKQRKDPIFLEVSGDLCLKPTKYYYVHFPDISNIKGRDGTKKKRDFAYNQTGEAQKLMKHERNVGHFTKLSIPFTISLPMKGVFIRVPYGAHTPARLVFTFFDSKGKKTIMDYEFSTWKERGWFML